MSKLLFLIKIKAERTSLLCQLKLVYSGFNCSLSLPLALSLDFLEVQINNLFWR
jgi:hypothetical protein